MPRIRPTETEFDALAKKVTLPPGTYNISGLLLAAHTTGSGNYVAIGFPFGLNGVTDAKVSVSQDAGTHISGWFTSTDYVTQNDIDLTYGSIVNRGDYGFVLELKFKTTKTANRDGVMRFGSATLTLT